MPQDVPLGSLTASNCDVLTVALEIALFPSGPSYNKSQGPLSQELCLTHLISRFGQMDGREKNGLQEQMHRKTGGQIYGWMEKWVRGIRSNKQDEEEESRQMGGILR